MDGTARELDVAAETPRILYIDDDRGLCRLAQRDLERQGLAVAIALSGPEGLALLQSNQRYDVVCLDHYMPEQDGLTTLEQIRALPDPPPVIYVTGADEGRVAVAALKAGAVDYVVKEVGSAFFSLLHSAVRHALEQVRLRRERDAVEKEVREARDRLQELNRNLEIRIAEAVRERQHALERLHHAQKMEAIGQLTGGTAHDFNNLLTVITGTLDLLAGTVRDDPAAERLLAAAKRAAQRGARLTDQLLSFGRRQALNPRRVDIPELIRESQPLAFPLLGETIRLQLDLSPESWPCHLDPTQFVSAILNILSNARDAMPNGGRLAIATENVTVSAAAAETIPDASPGDYLLVSIADDGVGMEAAILARAMEPFFTTKEVGKGTGLGLSQVYGFVRQSGGFITLQSRTREGTTIRLFLPRAADAEVMQAEEHPMAPPGSGTVLLAEDDEDVLVIVTNLLGALGYRVLQARSGPQALAILEQEAEIDLLLTDMVMPDGMSGAELIKLARERWPSVRAILTSGFAQTIEIEDGIPVLAKPYRKDDLARAIATVLGPD